MRFLGLVLINLCLLFLSNFNAGWADTPVYFSFISNEGRYYFSGGFTVKADRDVVWNVLTDFNHISNFVTNMHGHIEKCNGNDLLVQQDVGGGFLFIQEHIKALLSVHEEPFQSISFDDVSHKNFNLYDGVWFVQPDPVTDEVEVTYDIQACCNSNTPKFLTPDLFGSSLGQLLEQMQREMDRRQEIKNKILLQDAIALETAIPTPLITPLVTPIASPTEIEGITPISTP